MVRLSYEERANKCNNPLMKKLFEIIARKKTNLCVAADIKGQSNLLDLVKQIGPYICMLKIHDSYFIKDNILVTLEILNNLKKEYDFLLFEDNKCADNGEVTKVYYENYIKYVDVVTVCGHGPILGIEAAIKEANLPDSEPRGCLLLCQKSYAKTSDQEARNLLAIAESNSACVGIIAQDLKLNDDLRLFKATPGVHLSQSTGGLDQNYRPPSVAIENGSDVIIVGSGIIKAKPEEWAEKAAQYKRACWSAYEKDLKN